MISLDAKSSVPPYEQLRAQIAAQIRSGELPVNHRLPAIRQLAGELKLAPGTVAKTYSKLEAAGLIVTDGRRGSRVAAPGLPPQEQQKLSRLVGQVVSLASQLGVSQGDLAGMVASAWRAEGN